MSVALRGLLLGRSAWFEGERIVRATEMQRMTVGTERVRDTVRASAGTPDRPRSVGRVEEVLRTVPSHGWPAGWVGRRDRALLVLSELAGLSYGNIAALTAGDLTITGGVATIRTPGVKSILRDVVDDLQCGPCALARWVHALDLTVVYPDGRVIAALIARAVPLTPDSPHLCHSNNAITAITRRVPLLPPIDRWGHPVRARIRPDSPLLPAPGDARRDGHQVRPRRAAPASQHTTHRAEMLEHRVQELLNGSD